MSGQAAMHMPTTHHFAPSILRAYDIRGVVGESLHETDAYMLGRCFATYASRQLGRQPQIALARDGRLTSPMLKDALARGLMDSGASVVDYGLGPTPMLYFSVYHDNLDGGIMVTGSHNPPTHNGFKMMLGKASFFGEDIQKLGLMAETGNMEEGAGTLAVRDSRDAYLAALLGGMEALECPLKVAFDPGNGAAGEMTERLAAALPGEHIVINGAIDGTFPNHHPDPTVKENLEQLIAMVERERCDIGIAFDGDGDRIGAVDKKGRIIWGDQLMRFFAEDVLAAHPGATIIADVKARHFGNIFLIMPGMIDEHNFFYPIGMLKGKVHTRC